METAAREAARASADGTARAWRISVRSKFLIMMLLTSLLSLSAITYMAYQSGKAAITESAVNQLTSIRSAKKREVETYFRALRASFQAFSEVPDVSEAILNFADAFRGMGKEALAPARRRALEGIYLSELMPALGKTREQAPRLEDLMPPGAAGQELQALMIAESGTKLGERAKLETHPVETTYTRAHARHHRWLANLARRLMLDDLFLVDAEGNIVYTMAKEPDLGQSVINGPIAGTKLAQLAREIAQTRQPRTVRLTDFAFYWPSGDRPAGFIGAPLFKGGVYIGTVMAQISLDEIGFIMNDGGKWKEHGLGASGSAYIVGRDQLMRSNFRNLVETPDAFLESLSKQNLVPPLMVERMRAQKTTVLYYPIRNAPLYKGFQGVTATEFFVNQRGVGAFMSYAPLDIPDIEWVVTARMDENEVLASQIRFNRNVMIVACTIALLATLGALWMAGMFLRPVNALLGGIERLRNGERGVKISLRSNDEFNDLVGAFNGMSETIRERDEVIEGKSRAYEKLLRRIFPDVVADRMRQGEVSLVETYPQVTVIYAIIEGFTVLAGNQSAERSGTILSEIVDRLDNSAEQKGVEKVKTVGDHYLAISGLSVARLDSARRAIEFARLAWQEVQQVNREQGLELGLRIGIATGPVQVGLVGSRRFVFDVWGFAATAARRIAYEADVNAVRMNEEARGQLTDLSDVGDEMTVRMKSLGDLKTFQIHFAAAHDAEAAT